ncbi:ERF family protein [Microvirga sp. BT350]|uniref:ERF family protein n=2 Tax=Microvirga alba TaxID=2791025 RepID=A0A931BMH7_9HYPH|nr:ERF family protein [Microvirga alba]
MHGATKDRKNPAFKSEYATLASVIEAARGPLTENGIAFLQSPGLLTAEGLPITTTLMHISGEWVSTTLLMPVQKRDPQGIGSVITYGCRYSLMSLLGLPPVDDDGEAAMDRSPPKAQPKVVPPPRFDDDPFGPLASDESKAVYLRTCREIIDGGSKPYGELVQWWKDEAQNRRTFGLTQAETDDLKNDLMAKAPQQKEAAE